MHQDKKSPRDHLKETTSADARIISNKNVSDAIKRIENKVQDNHKEVNNVNVNASAKTLEEFKSKIIENIVSQNKSVEGY